MACACTSPLLEEILAKLSKSVEDEYSTLSALVDTLADPSGYAMASAVAEARDKGLIPRVDTAKFQAFSASEMKLYKHATTYKWTTDELLAAIKLIRSADFKMKDINEDLHKQVAAAVALGHFTSHNMR